jgi:hypothetical protein
MSLYIQDKIQMRTYVYNLCETYTTYKITTLLKLKVEYERPN